MSLNDLAVKYRTDKRLTGHNYVSVYESLFNEFREDTFNFLEIGIGRGASHKMWRDWFPNATIYGVDNAPATLERFKNEDRMILDYLHQGHKDQINEYAKKGPWRIIIDDGSHITSHQTQTFEILWGQVEPGGYYIIEDTHTSYPSFVLKQSVKTTDEINIWIDSAETFMERMFRLVNEVCEPAGVGRYHKEVEYLRFSPGLVVIKKKTNL